jgi:CxxC-x17-CxxC domain-containing protein
MPRTPHAPFRKEFKKSGDRRGTGREEREMFDAVCSSCGNACQVPFKPKGTGGVLCSNCFKKQKGEQGDGARKPGSGRGVVREHAGSSERRFSPTRDRSDREGDRGNHNEHGTRTSFKAARAEIYDTRIDDLTEEIKELRLQVERLTRMVSERALRDAVSDISNP